MANVCVDYVKIVFGKYPIIVCVDQATFTFGFVASESPSISASISPSLSPSASVSPSLSPSASVSPSASPSQAAWERPNVETITYPEKNKIVTYPVMNKIVKYTKYGKLEET